MTGQEFAAVLGSGKVDVAHLKLDNAPTEIRKIVDRANETWNLLSYAVSHRVGVLLPGDIAVVIAVATPHRKASFEACQFIIDSLKQTVPIWKREFFEDGDQWVSAHP